MKKKTIRLYICGAALILALPSSENFNTAIVVIILAALCFYLGYRSSKKNTNSSDSTFAGSIRTKVVGVTFQNDDGTERQQILKRVSPGDILELKPYKYKGEPAILVVHPLGCIGNLKATLAADLCKEQYIPRTAKVLNITGGSNGKSYGCNIEISEL